MARYMYDPETDSIVSSDYYYAKQYNKTAHLQMTNGNELVKMNFISDQMPETQHMIDGKMYTSKKAFRAATKAAGCVEVGNDTSYLKRQRKPIELDKRQRREEIKKTINDLRYGNIPKPVIVKK